MENMEQRYYRKHGTGIVLKLWNRESIENVEQRYYGNMDRDIIENMEQRYYRKH